MTMGSTAASATVSGMPASAGMVVGMAAEAAADDGAVLSLRG
jgi:hypothetical protein